MRAVLYAVFNSYLTNHLTHNHVFVTFVETQKVMRQIKQRQRTANKTDTDTNNTHHIHQHQHQQPAQHQPQPQPYTITLTFTQQQAGSHAATFFDCSIFKKK